MKKSKKQVKRMQMYYNEEFDIVCVVEGDEIWKYIGQFNPYVDMVHAFWSVDEWYPADNHPKYFRGFELIGEL